MKPILSLCLFGLGLVTLQSGAFVSANANAPEIFLKVSQTDVAPADDVTFDLFIHSVTDLYGFQLDVHTSLDEGALPFETIDEQTPFDLDFRSPFQSDTVYLNTFDETSSILTLLVMRPIQEVEGYNLNRVTLLASFTLKALVSITDLSSDIQISDDLLRMNIGTTNMTLKLSNSLGEKINYTLGVADRTAPIINVVSATNQIDVNGTFNAMSTFQYSDNRTSQDDLILFVSSFHDTAKEGEYILTVVVIDDFYNVAIATVVLIVGQPYADIVIREGSPA